MYIVDTVHQLTERLLTIPGVEPLGKEVLANSSLTF